MAFKKGQPSANPGGRVKDKVFTDALRLAIARTDEEGKTNLYKIAKKLVDLAVAGESWAVQQVADRLDGKPAQEQTIAFEKRDATDWSRDELVAILHDARKGGERATKANGRSGEPDSVH